MLPAEVLQPLSAELFWILCAAFLIAFLLAFSVGANDVSNSFGTSVGSRVLTVTQACILATIFEVAGATLLGYSVCDTFRKKMYNVSDYEGAQKELMLGALACLIGSALWNLVATALKMPISGTHSIVGATIGFSVASRGWHSIRWTDMARIVASWFASPLLSGLISSLIYALISKTIISKIDPLRHGLKALPLFYGATIFINVASIVIDGPEVLGLNELPWYAGLFIALLAAGATICYVAMRMVPRLRGQILDELVARRAPKRAGAFAGPARGRSSRAAQQVVASKRGAAYDNLTFKQEDTEFGESPARPNREPVSLDVARLAGDLASGPAGKPPVAPKPAHLRRQLAKDVHETLDEIDLSAGGGGGDDDGGGNDAGNDDDASVAKRARSAAHAKFSDNNSNNSNNNSDHSSDHSKILTDTGERYEVAMLFSSLQILTACFASFAHGTNDVSNAVAPLIPIWNIYTTGQEDVASQTQVWILAFGSIGICTGLWAWGRAVMATISEGLTRITPSKGFSIELGAAISVLCATKLGLPISTTHCKVGSLVVVGFVSSKFLSQDNLRGHAPRPLDAEAAAGKQELQIREQGQADGSVDWRLFGNIALTWVCTVPLAGIASAAVMRLLIWLVL